MFFNIYVCVCKTKSLPVLPFRAAYVGKRVKHTKFTRFSQQAQHYVRNFGLQSNKQITIKRNK